MGDGAEEGEENQAVTGATIEFREPMRFLLTTTGTREDEDLTALLIIPRK